MIEIYRRKESFTLMEILDFCHVLTCKTCTFFIKENIDNERKCYFARPMNEIDIDYVSDKINKFKNKPVNVYKD